MYLTLQILRICVNLISLSSRPSTFSIVTHTEHVDEKERKTCRQASLNACGNLSFCTTRISSKGKRTCEHKEDVNVFQPGVTLVSQNRKVTFLQSVKPAHQMQPATIFKVSLSNGNYALTVAFPPYSAMYAKNRWVSQNFHCERHIDVLLNRYGVLHGRLTIWNEAYKAAVLKAVQTELRKNQYTDILVTGYSLGAAVARFAAFELSLVPFAAPYKLSLVTFGEVRTGDDQWVRAHEWRKINARSIVLRDKDAIDPMTLMPHTAIYRDNEDVKCESFPAYNLEMSTGTIYAPGYLTMPTLGTNDAYDLCTYHVRDYPKDRYLYPYASSKYFYTKFTRVMDKLHVLKAYIQALNLTGNTESISTLRTKD